MPNDESDWLATIARASGAAVLLLDDEGELLAADAAALRLLGAESANAARQRWRDRHAEVARLRDASHGGEGAEIEISTAAGATRIAVRPIAVGGTRQRVVLLGAPHTTPADERAAFARKLGHDLRGPLNAMVLNLDLLRTALESGEEDVDEALRAKRARYLASLHREIGRMSDLLGAAVAEVRSAG